MPDRLTHLVTRRGDDGTTGLADGSRVTKDSARVEALGAVDELNAVLGCLLAEALPRHVEETLRAVQHTLFEVGAELALPPAARVRDEAVVALERVVAEWNASLGPLREFILPGGSRAAAQAHLARTVCRRAERRLVALAAAEPVSAALRRYLNRLSDLLFVAARDINRHHGVEETFWHPR